MIIIYKHKNKINGKVYIGQTNNIETRWKPISYKRSPRFYRAIQKYGWENFTHEILSEIEDQNEADNQEISLIEYFDSTNPENGYNILPGGGINTRGMKHSEETKNKISKTKTGKNTGENSPFYGKHHSDEHRNKMLKSFLEKYGGENHPNAKPVYLIDITNDSREYYSYIKAICKKHPEWNYKSLVAAVNKKSLFKKRYKIEYIEGD